MKLLFLFLLGLIQIEFSIQAKDWDYSVETVSSKASHPDIFNIKLRPKRIERGKYGLSGTVIINEELDDSVLVEVQSYRSERGNSDYKLTPFKVPESKFYKFMDDVYINLGVMKSVANCSNLIQFEGDKWEQPFPVGEYTAKDCLISTEPFPDHLQEGYYKIVLIAHNDVYNCVVEAVVKVEKVLT